MAMGQMEGIDEYDLVFEMSIPDEVIQQDTEHNWLSLVLNTSIITEERNIQNNTPNQQQNDLENHENSTRNSNDGNNSTVSTDENSDDDDQADDDLHYEVENDFQPNAPENLPQYPIDNKMFDVPEQDILNNWEWKHRDTGSSFGPFITEASTVIDLNDPVPELFFNSLFDNRMWTIITEATNSYAHTKSITPQGIYYFK